MVLGFKCFDKGLLNNYGMEFYVGETYKVEGNIRFGLWGNGYHMCKNLEDTLRYFDGMNREVDICMVSGTGNICKFDDDYNGYYDMYAVEELHVIKLLTRSEIIDMVLNYNEFRVKRFLMGYKLDDKEISLFLNKFKNNMDIIDAISYYQYGNKETYSKKMKR